MFHEHTEKSKVHTSLDFHTVTWFAPAVSVLCHHTSCVILTTVQPRQITLVLIGGALIHVAISTHGPHLVKLSSSDVVPRHGGHIVAAAQVGFEVVRNTRHWGSEINKATTFMISSSLCLSHQACTRIPNVWGLTLYLKTFLYNH